LLIKSEPIKLVSEYNLPSKPSPRQTNIFDQLSKLISENRRENTIRLTELLYMSSKTH
jgi:hypothetical protein